MPLSKTHLHLAVKALLAFVMLSGLAGVAGSQLAPNVTLVTILLNCTVWAAIIFSVLIVTAVVTLTFNQFSNATWRY